LTALGLPVLLFRPFWQTPYTPENCHIAEIILELSVVRQNPVTIDIVDFLQPGATLYWHEGITILAVLLF
jgi:hypothetical protein